MMGTPITLKTDLRTALYLKNLAFAEWGRNADRGHRIAERLEKLTGEENIHGHITILDQIQINMNIASTVVERIETAIQEAGDTD